MRLAWQAKRLAPANAPARVKTIPELTTVVIYNLVWWIPIILAFTPLIGYTEGFVAFLVVTTFRAAANVYRNNVLSGEAARAFPLRSP